jgi:hypothetical protein
MRDATGTRSLDETVATGSGVHTRRAATPQSEAGTLLSLGRPIKAGWNKTAATIVLTNANAISLPMLEVAGSADSHRLPKAEAVARALKITARVRVDCTNAVFPLRHAMM